MRSLVARLLFYPTLGWNLFLWRILPWRRWCDSIDEHVILGALPFASNVADLHDSGVRAVVNACAETEGPVKEYERYGITQLCIPTTDFNPPGLEDIQRAIVFMREHTERGERVYVHCKAGRGRGATVVLCWLIATKGMASEAAQAVLLQKRPHVLPKLYHRVVVQEFQRSVVDGDSSRSTPLEG